MSALPGALRERLAQRLRTAAGEIARRYPGEDGSRQPVHTVYGGAHLFRADTARRLGELASKALAEYAPTPAALGAALDLPVALASAVHPRVVEKLEREPVEDFRIDFEDGYGHRPDSEEDGHATSAAAEVARGLEAGTLPPFLGVRIKPLSAELAARALRTLELFLATLIEGAGRLPENFVVTLPKITSPVQVEALAEALEGLERALGLAAGALRLEVMIETPQSIFGADGEVAPRRLVDAAGGRCVAAHFGTYDYTASLAITAAHQHMTHPACDFARQALQVALQGSGVRLADGATNVLPVAPHRAGPGGGPLPPASLEANRLAVRGAWRLHYRHVRHSLEGGYYQGWDLHPAQLVTRYAAVHAFFLESLESACERLRNFIAKAAQATLQGEVFDDAATGQGLLNYFLRALNCGAVTAPEVLERTGLSHDELLSRSFVEILRRRRAS
jgi:citrate lyase beta subunit